MCGMNRGMRHDLPDGGKTAASVLRKCEDTIPPLVFYAAVDTVDICNLQWCQTATYNGARLQLTMVSDCKPSLCDVQRESAGGFPDNEVMFK
jgi:hypothetical protein